MPMWQGRAQWRCRQRHPFYAKWKVGAAADGKLQALDVQVSGAMAYGRAVPCGVQCRAMRRAMPCHAMRETFVMLMPHVCVHSCFRTVDSRWTSRGLCSSARSST